MNTTREIPVESVRVFVSRAREQAGFERLKSSMAEYGLRVPIQVRDLKRKDEHGRRYELICGQGRLTAARDLGWPTIPALIIEAEEAEIAGRFLAENMIRKSLPWAEKGALIRDEMHVSGETIEAVAKRLHISPNYARKCVRVMNKTATGLEDEVQAMPMNTAEVFTTLPADGQKLVMEVVKETGAEVEAVVRKARKLPSGFTKTALRDALAKVDRDLAAAKDRLRLLRLHRAIGPQNLETLLAKKVFRAALEAEGVNLSRIK